MIVYEYTTSPILVGIALVVSLGVLVFSVHRFVPLSLPNILISGVRVLVLLLLFWCILLPTRRDVEIQTVKPRFIVLLDTTESMTLSPGDAHPNRWSHALESVNLPWRDQIASQCDIDAYGFAETLGPRMALAAISNLSPRAKTTRIHDTLARLEKTYAGQDVAGVLVLSDGLDTRETSDEWAARTWPWPLYTVSYEDLDAWEVEPDVRVESVNTPRRVVVGWQSELKAIISGQGTGGDAVNVTLKQDSAFVDARPAQLPQEGGSAELAFALHHPEEGTFEYTVVASPLPGETRTNDNVLVVSIQVVDARNQLLYVEGAPRWESKYLSRSLRASDRVTPLIFIRGPKQKFMTIGQRGNITAEMSASDLARFKIVVIGNLDAEELGEERARNLLTFVDNGGSLILLGGDKGWGPNGFLQTPLKPLLPVRQHDTTIVEGQYPVLLTDIGRGHPAFAGDKDLWESLPSILSRIPGAELSAIAESLVDIEVDGGMQPLIATQRYGQGKVLAIMTDSLWRWGLGAPQAGGSPYKRFWEQLLVWMLPEEEAVNGYRIDVFADHDEAFLGERVTFSARLGEAFPDNVESVTCKIIVPDQRVLPFQMAAGQIATSGSASFAGYASHFDAQASGLHKVVVEVLSEGMTYKSDELAFYVRAYTPESIPRPAGVEVLRALSRSSRGRFFDNPQTLDETLGTLQVSTAEEEYVQYASLWQHPLIIVCLIGLLAIEWIVRRFRNLP